MIKKLTKIGLAIVLIFSTFMISTNVSHAEEVQFSDFSFFQHKNKLIIRFNMMGIDNTNAGFTVVNDNTGEIKELSLGYINKTSDGKMEITEYVPIEWFEGITESEFYSVKNFYYTIGDYGPGSEPEKVYVDATENNGLQGTSVSVHPSNQPFENFSSEYVKFYIGGNTEKDDYFVYRQGDVEKNNVESMWFLDTVYQGSMHISNWEIIDNPALKAGFVDTVQTFEMTVKADIEYQGESKEVEFKLPAQVVPYKGKVSGRTHVREYAVKYEGFESMFEYANPKPEITFDVELEDGTVEEVTLYMGQGGGGLNPDNPDVAYAQFGGNYLTDLQYDFIETEEEKAILEEYMVPEGEFLYLTRVYFMDDNRNLVDSMGNPKVALESRPEIKYTTDTDAIKLNSKLGSLPTYTELKVNWLYYPGEELEDKTYVAYDMNLYADGEKVQPVDEVEVGIVIPEFMEDEELSLVYIDDDKKTHPLQYDTKDGVAYFTTNHFSAYALVTEKIEMVVPEIDENTDIKDFGIKVGDYYLEYGKDYAEAWYFGPDPEDESYMIYEIVLRFFGDYASYDNVVRTYRVKRDVPTVTLPEVDKKPDLDKLEIVFGEETLIKDKDYTVSVTEKEGAITVTIDYIGDYDWVESVVKTYKEDKPVEPVKPDIIISEIDKDTDLDKLVIKDNDKVLVKDKDYTITKVEKDGLVTVTIDFIGKYDEVESIVKSYKVETDSEDKPVPPTEDKDDNVQTDDTTNVAMLFTVMLLSGAGFILLNRKTREE